ncbi:MAG TPA: DUF202 domain-containing protein [bacterium]|nr:DUF202 domain-containing protein [bacterium]
MAEKDSIALDANSLAVERTRLAHDRTLMAWVRTSTSLISFGFTIYKFFQFMIQVGHVSRIPQRLGPRQFGSMMILLGMFALVGATIQYRYAIKPLRKAGVKSGIALAEVVSGLLLAFGLLLLIVTILNQ